MAVEYETLYVDAAIFRLADWTYHHRFLSKELNYFYFVAVFGETDTHVSNIFGGKQPKLMLELQQQAVCVHVLIEFVFISELYVFFKTRVSDYHLGLFDGQTVLAYFLQCFIVGFIQFQKVLGFLINKIWFIYLA